MAESSARALPMSLKFSASQNSPPRGFGYRRVHHPTYTLIDYALTRRITKSCAHAFKRCEQVRCSGHQAGVGQGAAPLFCVYVIGTSNSLCPVINGYASL